MLWYTWLPTVLLIAVWCSSFLRGAGIKHCVFLHLSRFPMEGTQQRVAHKVSRSVPARGALALPARPNCRGCRAGQQQQWGWQSLNTSDMQRSAIAPWKKLQKIAINTGCKIPGNQRERIRKKNALPQADCCFNFIAIFPNFCSKKLTDL